MKNNWDARQIADLGGNTAIVTGANSGIGYHTALELGRAGAHVIVACRDPARASEALARLQAEAPRATFEVESLDLAELASVRAFAARFLARDVALDLLVNNAGIMAIPTRTTTVDGFERQFATNHLGHFALTGLLLPALRRAAAPRVVSVSSSMAFVGKLDLANLQSERRYSPPLTYAATKLANLLFMQELGRRYLWLTSVAAHPGATRTNLQRHGSWFTHLFMKAIGQEADIGALPTLYAATGEAASGEFYGPSKLMHMQGPPVEVSQPKRAQDAPTARALWTTSETLTGVRYDVGAG